MITKKKSHIFNIDNLLINIDQKVWIIEKNNPNVCLMKLPKEDYDLIKTGIYKNDGLSMSFNGKKYWLSRSVFEKLQKSVQRLSTSEELSFSFREYTDPDTIQDMKVSYDVGPIAHLKNTIDDIYFVSTKGTERRYGQYYIKLIDSLKEDGILIKQVYYINQSYFAQSDDINIKKLCHVILSNVSGRMIKDDKLSDSLDRDYSEVHYYDSNYTSVHKIKSQINSFYKRLYVDETYNIINCKLFLNLVGSNTLNPFTSIEVDLNKYIRTFEEFKFSTHTNLHLLSESVAEFVLSGYSVGNYIRRITPIKSNVPDYFISKFIEPNNFTLKQVSIYDLMQSDPSFAEYIKSDTNRYTDLNTDGLKNPVVVVDNEVLDGYNRMLTLLSLGEQYVDAYVNI